MIIYAFCTFLSGPDGQIIQEHIVIANDNGRGGTTHGHRGASATALGGAKRRDSNRPDDPDFLQSSLFPYGSSPCCFWYTQCAPCRRATGIASRCRRTSASAKPAFRHQSLADILIYLSSSPGAQNVASLDSKSPLLCTLFARRSLAPYLLLFCRCLDVTVLT